DMVTDWLELRNLASPAQVAPTDQTTLTADLFGVTGTSTTPLAPGSLDGLAPFPVPPATIFGNPVNGSLSGAGTQFVDGLVAATLNLSNLAVGSHSVTATYTGDADFNPSVSTPTTQVVNKADTSVAVGSSPNPSISGQGVGFSATVTATAPGAGTPTGTVQF